MDHVALLRGVNVGTAKRVAMADLRQVAARLADENPLRDDAPDGRGGREPKLLSVAFAEVPGALGGVAPPDVDLGDEELVVSPDVVYQWLPAGVLASRVPAAWWRGLPTPVTARNDATVRKLQALLARRAP